MNKTLIIQTAFLGDAVLTLPMIQYLKKQNPLCNISVLCIPSTSLLFSNSPYIDEVIVYDKKKTQRTFFDFIKMIKNIRTKKFTSVISPHRSFRSTIIAYSSSAKSRIGFDKAVLNFLYTKRVRYRPDIHEVQRNLSLVDFEQNNDWQIKPEIKINQSVSSVINSIVSEFSKYKLVAVAPGSVWATKVYPKDSFKEIIIELAKKDFRILLIGGPEDRILCEELSCIAPQKAISVAGKLSVIESIEILKRCKGLISNDSAPTHLGMIADIPVLTIYCSTIPGFGFSPYNKKSAFISLEGLKCKPCGIHGHQECPIKTFDCGFKLMPADVLKKFYSVISD